MIRCKTTTATVTWGDLRCQLWKGHKGQHFLIYPEVSARWWKWLKFVWSRVQG